MKKIIFLGSSLKELQRLESKEKERVAYQLERLKIGLMPTDWKPMKSIGDGVNEVRIHGIQELRIIYVAKFANAVYILHVFGKKSQKTSAKDLEIAKQRYKALRRELL